MIGKKRFTRNATRHNCRCWGRSETLWNAIGSVSAQGPKETISEQGWQPNMRWERVRTNEPLCVSHLITQVACRSWCPSQVHVHGLCPERWDAEDRYPTGLRGAGVPTCAQGQHTGLEVSLTELQPYPGALNKPSEWYGYCFASSPTFHTISLGDNLESDKERNSRNRTCRLAKWTQNHTDYGHHPSETGLLLAWETDLLRSTQKSKKVPDPRKR